MKFIEFDSQKCDDCFKCLRLCPTKAIAFTDQRRDIVDTLCIKCGLCQASCPQEALTIQNDHYQIKKHIKLGKTIVASLAPSFAAALNTDQPKKLITALRQLGFHFIEETGIAAEMVSQSYQHHLQETSQKNILTTCCPSANHLIQYYYPELLDYMLPVVSPMIAHGRMIKEKYGKEVFVVFIGPCLAKKAEAEDFPGAIDAVITFNELLKWLQEANIDYNTLESGEFDAKATIRGMSYPAGGSLFENDHLTPLTKDYKMLRVDGFERCQDLLESIKQDKIGNYCIEINICKGSCVNGPDMPHDGQTYYQRKDRMRQFLKQHETMTTLLPEVTQLAEKLDLSCTFKKHKTSIFYPSETEINAILMKIDKFSIKDHLNCGACGYETCRDKAIAVFNHLSQPEMCMPYLRSKAESLSSAIFEHTPNLVCVLDHQLILQESNPTFTKAFQLENGVASGIPIDLLMPETLFKTCLETKTSQLGQREHIAQLNQVFYCNAIYTEKFILGIMTDITLFEKSRQEMAIVKERTITACQEVINKQMRVAQEIASLLGETTAETKVNLNRLRDLVLRDEGY